VHTIGFHRSTLMYAEGIANIRTHSDDGHHSILLFTKDVLNGTNNSIILAVR